MSKYRHFGVSVILLYVRVYMGYMKGATGQCAHFEMCFLLHVTCTNCFEIIFLV